MRNVILAITMLASACASQFHAELPVETRLDIVSRYVQGESLDTIAKQFHLHGRDDVRAIVDDVMIALADKLHQAR